MPESKVGRGKGMAYGRYHKLYRGAFLETKASIRPAFDYPKKKDLQRTEITRDPKLSPFLPILAPIFARDKMHNLMDVCPHVLSLAPFVV